MPPLPIIISLIKKSLSLGIEVNFTLRQIPGRENPEENVPAQEDVFPPTAQRRRGNKYGSGITHFSRYCKELGLSPETLDWPSYEPPSHLCLALFHQHGTRVLRKFGMEKP